MKHSTTRFISILALVFFSASAGALVFFVFQVVNAGAMLNERAEAIATMNASLRANTELGLLIEETEQQRQALADLVLTEERTSQFLTQIEEMAVQSGVSLTTESLEVIEQKEKTHNILSIKLQIEGRNDLVVRMLQLLEVLPYHSVVETLSFTKEADQTAEARVTLLVTLKK